jgi:hypothetical protein
LIIFLAPLTATFKKKKPDDPSSVKILKVVHDKGVMIIPRATMNIAFSVN